MVYYRNLIALNKLVVRAWLELCVLEKSGESSKGKVSHAKGSGLLDEGW